MTNDIKFNDDDPAAIRAALRVARQCYVRAEAPTHEEMRAMLRETSEIYPESETKVPNDVLALMVSGMLRFAEVVEKHQGVDRVRGLANAIANDMRGNPGALNDAHPDVRAAIEMLLEDRATA